MNGKMRLGKDIKQGLAPSLELFVYRILDVKPENFHDSFRQVNRWSDFFPIARMEKDAIVREPKVKTKVLPLRRIDRRLGGVFCGGHCKKIV